MGHRRGRGLLERVRVHFPLGESQQAMTAHALGKMQQQRALSRPQGNKIHYLRLWYLILGRSKMLF